MKNQNNACSAWTPTKKTGLAMIPEQWRIKNDSELQQTRLRIHQKKCYNLANDINYWQLQSPIKKTQQSTKTQVHTSTKTETPTKWRNHNDATLPFHWRANAEMQEYQKSSRLRQKMTPMMVKHMDKWTCLHSLKEWQLRAENYKVREIYADHHAFE